MLCPCSDSCKSSDGSDEDLCRCGIVQNSSTEPGRSTLHLDMPYHAQPYQSMSSVALCSLRECSSLFLSINSTFILNPEPWVDLKALSISIKTYACLLYNNNPSLDFLF